MGRRPHHGAPQQGRQHAARRRRGSTCSSAASASTTTTSRTASSSSRCDRPPKRKRGTAHSLAYASGLEPGSSPSFSFSLFFLSQLVFPVSTCFSCPNLF